MWHLAEKSAKMISPSQSKLCLLCQDYTDHETSKCPFMICKNCGKTGHSNKHCPYNYKSQDITCASCKGSGHVKIDCPVLFPDQFQAPSRSTVVEAPKANDFTNSFNLFDGKCNNVE